jgi:hypothetical protein
VPREKLACLFSVSVIGAAGNPPVTGTAAARRTSDVQDLPQSAQAEEREMISLFLVRSAALLALAGCAAAAAGTPPSSSPPAGARSVPYSLYTHCGIGYARIGGHWYRASPPLSDGSGNPPGGWGNPYQEGTIQVTSRTEAKFSDTAGHHVRFVLQPGVTRPPQICS